MYSMDTRGGNFPYMTYLGRAVFLGAKFEKDPYFLVEI